MLVKLFQLTRATLKSLGLWWLTFVFLSMPALAQGIAPRNIYPSTPDVDRVLPETPYILGAGDRIGINILLAPEFSGEYQILVDGTLSLPLVGNVSLAGLTLSEANQLLLESYSLYLNDPIVAVSLIAPRPLKIAIAGEITRPGSYNISLVNGQTFPTLTDFIQQAGGLTTAADISQVQIRRFVQGREQVFQLNLWPLVEQANLSQDITLRDGDSIFIPTKDEINPEEVRQLTNATFGIQQAEVEVAVAGEVYRPGSHATPPRLTAAIRTAGGIKPLANVRQIEVRRFTRTGSEETLKVDLWQLLETGDLEQDVILQQGDTIIIPTAQALEPSESEALASASFAPDTITVTFIGEINRAGAIQIPPNTPLNQAISLAGGFNIIRADARTVELIRLNFNGTVTRRDIDIDPASGVEGENNPPLRDKDVIFVSRNVLTAVTDTLNTFLRPLGTISGFVRFVDVFSDRRR